MATAKPDLAGLLALQQKEQAEQQQAQAISNASIEDPKQRAAADHRVEDLDASHDRTVHKIDDLKEGTAVNLGK